MYRDFARQWAARTSGSARSDYDDLHEDFIATRYGWSDFLSTSLQRFGVEARDIYVAEPLQRAWARSRDLRWRGTDDILVEQVREFAPDVVFLPDLFRFAGPLRDRLRSVMPAGGMLVGWRGEPTTDFRELADLDAVASSLPSYVRSLQDAGVRSFHLPFAFDARLLDEVGDVPRGIALSFAGTISGAEGPHSYRREVVEALLESTPLQVWSAATSDTRTRNLGRRAVYLANRVLAQLGLSERTRAKIPGIGLASGWAKPPVSAADLSHRFSERFHPPVYGSEYFELLRRSKLALNVHVDIARSEVGNVRLFEATGMGACLVTDLKQDLADYFEPDDEVVAFETPEGASEVVRELLADPERADRIARAGQRRTLRDHTYDHLAARLLDEIGLGSRGRGG